MRRWLRGFTVLAPEVAGETAGFPPSCPTVPINRCWGDHESFSMLSGIVNTKTSIVTIAIVFPIQNQRKQAPR
jgi:hypothetical protein